VLGVSTLIYLGENPELAAARHNKPAATTIASIRVWVDTTLGAFLNDHSCVGETATQRQADRAGSKAVVPQAHVSTNAANEALQLSIFNASVIANPSSEAARRMYGCLYGFETGGAYAIVPPGVSSWSFAQRFFSAIFIFLFGLGVRNMLKMKT
jgi:hypothetical protein